MRLSLDGMSLLGNCLLEKVSRVLNPLSTGTNIELFPSTALPCADAKVRVEKHVDEILGFV